MKDSLILAVLVALTASATTFAQTTTFTHQSQRDDQSTAASNSMSNNRDHALFGSVVENRLRFSSLGELLQLRLEIITPAGETLFDSGFKAGNVVEWLALDNQGQAVAEATYLCLVTVKDAASRLTKHHALVIARDQAVSLRQVDNTLLAPAQAQAAGESSDADESLTLVEAAGSSATAILAHSGALAHLVSGRGGLSISSGDFFANKVVEHIRITAEGNVGIGVAIPQARLDVAGRIKATEGIVFPDGSVQLSAAKKTLGAASLKPSDSQDAMAKNASPDTSGTGTTGKIPKWLDGPTGVLGDSNITEASGAIGINGAPSTSFRLDVNGSTRIRGSNPGFNLEGLRAAGNIWLFQTVDDDGRFRLFGQDNVNPGVERLTISLSTGNVGIGATGAAGKLDVGGAINTSTQYNIGGDRILSNGGSFNLFAGAGAGLVNAGGAANAFFGSGAGARNTEGGDNSFFGYSAGLFNTTEFGNTFIGSMAGFRNGDGDTNNIAGNNTFIGGEAGANNTTGAGNVFVGANAGLSNLTGNRSTAIGYSADVGANNLVNATAIGANARVSQSNSLVLGSINGTNGATADTRVGIGTTAPGYKLEIVDAGNAGLRVQTNTTGGTLASFAANGDFEIDKPFISGGRFNVRESGNVGISVQIPQDKLDVNGFVRLRQLASGNFTTLCINNSSQISNCSSSMRYKTNIAKLPSSLMLINQLHPVTFNWKTNNQPDVGLIAEEVAKVEPLLTFRNDKGEIEGVKYDRVAVVLINAVKEQQHLIAQQQQQIEALKKLVCSSHRKSKGCR